MLLGAVAFLLIISGTACHKTNIIATGTFRFHLHSNIDTNEIADSSFLYRDAMGRHFSLNIPQFYISGVTLVNANGNNYTIPNVYILKTLDSEEYLIGTAPVGTYTSVIFNVGLDVAANSGQPSGYTVGNPLAQSSMWFGNTTKGYMFMKLQGLADTTALQTGMNPVPFSYEIGSAANLKQVTMPVRGSGSYSSYTPYILTAGSTQYIHMICDYGKLLSVVNFSTQDSTDTYNINPTLATTIANNIPAMFKYEQ